MHRLERKPSPFCWAQEKPPGGLASVQELEPGGAGLAGDGEAWPPELALAEAEACALALPPPELLALALALALAGPLPPEVALAEAEAVEAAPSLPGVELVMSMGSEGPSKACTCGGGRGGRGAGDEGCGARVFGCMLLSQRLAGHPTRTACPPG